MSVKYLISICSFSQALYTQMTSKIGFCLRRAATKFAPACIAKLFKFSCFGAASAGVNLGRLLGISQLLKSFVYIEPLRLEGRSSFCAYALLCESGLVHQG